VAAKVRAFEHQYINGQWVESTNAPKSLNVIDSNTEKVIATVPKGSKADAEKAIAAARAAFPAWSATPLPKRKEYIEKFLEAHKKKREETVSWLMKELGCTRAFSNVQFSMMEGHGRALLEGIDTVQWAEASGTCTVVKEPIGVIGCITPWNYPLNQIACKILPAMLAGCTVVLKPSEVTPVCAYLVAEAIHEAGLPAGVFNMVVGEGPDCGEVLPSHPDVDLISFTGSTRAGRAISAAALATLKPVKTELGGKSAAILLDDADLKQVVPVFLGQLMSNSGQTCIALSRMLVPRTRYEEAVTIAREYVEGVVVAPSDDPKATIGPVASQMHFDAIQAFLQKGVDEGARLVSGGPGRPAGLTEGYFVKPTVFADVDNKMTIAQQEIFGPVLSMIPYDTVDEAVDIANDTVYGLNNAVASPNKKRCLKVASRLRSGMVMVNTTHLDFNAPFGGYKQSGNAREWGLWGLDEFLVTKMINISFEEYQEAMK